MANIDHTLLQLWQEALQSGNSEDRVTQFFERLQQLNGNPLNPAIATFMPTHACQKSPPLGMGVGGMPYGF